MTVRNYELLKKPMLKSVSYLPDMIVMPSYQNGCFSPHYLNEYGVENAAIRDMNNRILDLYAQNFLPVDNLEKNLHKKVKPSAPPYS